MKHFFFLITLLFVITIAYGQTSKSTVYLKNGSIIKGKVIELNTNENIKIKTSDGSLFVYKMSEVSKVVSADKENINSGRTKSSYTVSNKSSYYNITEVDGFVNAHGFLSPLTFGADLPAIIADPNGGSLALSAGTINGIQISTVNGYQFRNKLFAGIGIGYRALKDIPVVPFYLDVRYFFSQKKTRPFIAGTVGYDRC